jgi:hypothetical protein
MPSSRICSTRGFVARTSVCYDDGDLAAGADTFAGLADTDVIDRAWR